jgi:putative ABC transport system permease protein
MSLNENFHESVRSLWASKQRSLLALIGIVIGIGSVIAMITIGRIVEQEAVRHFKEMGTDICTVRLHNQEGTQRGESSTSSFKLQNVLQIPTHCTDVIKVAPYCSTYGDLTYEGQRLSCPALGVTESFVDIFKVPVIQGRFISDLDTNSMFCVLSQSIYEKMAKKGGFDPIGEQIVFDGKVYYIIGVTARVPMGGFRPYAINEGIFLPIVTVLRSPIRPKIRVFNGRLSGEGVRLRATAQLTDYFRRLDRKMNLKITTAEELVAQMNKQMRMFTLLLAAIGSISLIVGGVGVMNVMLVSVSERRREIGIRRALGARQFDIQMQFLVESVLLSFVGGTLGIALGVGASYIICNFTGWQFLASREAIILGVGVSAAVGVFFGFYPARQASRLSPIDALRTD